MTTRGDTHNYAPGNGALTWHVSDTTDRARYGSFVAPKESSNLFSALLKFWRGKRGMSQLDLALAADVSSRHISFLETGRSQPSREMILRLGTTMQVPLRDQNALLDAAGFEAEFATPGIFDDKDSPAARAIDHMLKQAEPYPMVVLDGHHNMVRANQGAQALLAYLVDDMSALAPPINLVDIVFNPRLLRPVIADWEDLARAVLTRLQRDVLERPQDAELRGLLEAALEYDGVPTSWRRVDFTKTLEPVLTFKVKKGDTQLEFLTTLTVFNSAQSVTFQEVQLESYFPLDDVTRDFCHQQTSG